jgi:hypothetical protein
MFCHESRDGDAGETRPDDVPLGPGFLIHALPRQRGVTPCVETATLLFLGFIIVQRLSRSLLSGTASARKGRSWRCALQ